MTTLAQLTDGQIVGIIALSILMVAGLLISMTVTLGPAMQTTDKQIALEELSTEQAAREWFDRKWGQGTFDRTHVDAPLDNSR